MSAFLAAFSSLGIHFLNIIHRRRKNWEGRIHPILPFKRLNYNSFDSIGMIPAPVDKIILICYDIS